MRKLFIGLAIGCLLPLVSMAQHYSISGKVLDNTDWRQLPGAHIVLENTYQVVFADRNGGFLLEGLPEGSYTLRISFIGFKTMHLPIELKDDLVVDILLEPSASMTEEVVVTALRAEGRSPVTRTDVTREEIASRNLGQDLPFLLRQTPSLVVGSDAGSGVGYTWMSIRGSDQSRINVTINGIPVNDSESHGVWWVNMPDVVSSLENLQVQRGVGLSTHGAAAFGATINLQSSPLRDEIYAELSASAGSFNTMKNTVSFGTGLLNNNWAFDGRMSRIGSDGYIDRATSDLKSFYLSGGYYGSKTMVKAIVFSGKETTYQAWNGVPSDSLPHNPTFNPSGMYTDEMGRTQYYDNETDNYQQDHHQLHFAHSISRDWTATAALHYTRGRGYYEQYRENDRFSRYNLSPAQVGEETIYRSDMIRRRLHDNHFYGLVYSLKYNPRQRVSLILGGGGNIYDGDHYGEIIWARLAPQIDKGARYYDNNGYKTDINNFAKLEIEIMPGLQALVDLQYRNISYRFLGQAYVHGEVVPLEQRVRFHFFNPKAGLSYSPAPSHSFHLFGGIGNREPVRRDFTESSPDSRPRHETMYNMELGYTHKGNRTRLGLNAYLMDYNDQLILTGEINDVGGYSRTNIDDSYRAGFEFEAAFRPAQWVEMSGNLTLSRNKIKQFEEHSDQYDDQWNWVGVDVKNYENTDIAFSPSVIGSGAIQLSPWTDVSIYLEGKYVGSQFIDNTMHPDRKLDSYFVNDLRLQWVKKTTLLNEVEVLIQVNNLFNVDYVTNAWIYKGVVGGEGLMVIDDGYFPQAGRHFLVGLNLRF